MSFNEWKEYKLGEIYEFSSGLSKSREEFGYGYEFLTFKDVFYNYCLPEELNELVNSTETEREKCSIKRGDVFFTRTSETLEELGMSSVALKDYKNATFNGFTKRLRPKGNANILPEYVAYYFRSPRFRKEITCMSSMTTRASLNNDMLAILKLVVPTLNEQRGIAKILSDIDSKIKVNNQINKKLEEMAQTIFKEWFVDFQFPNEEGESYKSSNGEMVESQMGLIPKGWKVGYIKQLGYIQGGYAFKGSKLIDKPTNYKIIKIKNISNNLVDISNTQYIDFEYFQNVNKKFQLNDGEVVVAMTGAELGKTGQIFNMGNVLLLNQRVGVVRSENKFNKNYLDVLFLGRDFQEKINCIGYGSAQPNISTRDIESIIQVIPNSTILELFYKVTNSILRKKVKNAKQNQLLTNIRDTILPKLISGEIRVPLD